jgi:serine/threonine protein kinase
MTKKKSIECPSCHHPCPVDAFGEEPRYCPFCASPLFPHLEPTVFLGADSPSAISTSVSLVKGHLPIPQSVQFAIGPYQVLRSIGKGGMGEVFLAYDTVCGRRIALKKIRTDLLSHEQLYHRFLKEARITSQLTHPSIITIFTIHEEPNLIYYTMPYVEGETLKQMLRHARQKERISSKNERSNGSSIPAMLRIFISICQAIAYAHAKGVLHRDIKPENIIVGRYGEVQILDWGLAKLLHVEEGTTEFTELDDDDSMAEEHPPSHPLYDITRMGKVVGTISYMAPERALGQAATVQTDIYALGVILYQILTLRKPFHRGTLKEFRKNMHQEILINPAEVAPYRDVPPILSRMVEKTLSKDPEERYETVDELIHDIETYLEGRADWLEVAQLRIDRKEDWIFQENILITDRMAIMRHLEASDWVSLMISKTSYPENIKIETTVTIGEKGNGIGFLLALPEGQEGVHLNEGYHLWLGSDLYKSTKLIRSRVEMVTAPTIYLQRGHSYTIRIEKIDTHLHFYIDDVLQFSYISHLPLIGTHIGLLARDADFTISSLNIFVSSHTIMVKCLAVPDAFLAHGDYEKALSEYRRIAYSFPGRAESREALFRAGITLLEQGNHNKEPGKADQYYDLALIEFEKLQKTAGAPLAYLGKALVYEQMEEYSEEIKCYELAYRRYPHHPLLPILQEQIICRMHESSHKDRFAAYQFILLAIRYLSIHEMSDHTKRMFEDLQRHWEKLPFIDIKESLAEPFKSIQFGIQLAFWLGQVHLLEEMVDKLMKITIFNLPTLANALFSLVALGEEQTAIRKIAEVSDLLSTWDVSNDEKERWQKITDLLRLVISSRELTDDEVIQQLLPRQMKSVDRDLLRAALMILEQAVGEKKTQRVHAILQRLQQYEIPVDVTRALKAFEIWTYLQEKNWEQAGKLLQECPQEALHKETSIIHFLYGCWLAATQGKDKAQTHFMGILDAAYPRSWALFSHYVKRNSDIQALGLNKAFEWEKRQFYKQAELYAHSLQ